MKKLIKAIVPAPVIRKAAEAKDWLQLAKAEKLPFDPANLRAANEISLERIFFNPKIKSAWDEDHVAIKSLYGNEDSHGGVNPGDRRALYYLIMALNPKSVLEVGTHIGASTLHIARAMKRIGGGKVTSADIIDVNKADGPWRQNGLKFSPAGYAKELNCLEQIEFKVGKCLEFMGKTDKRFDFIFLDGDHRAKAVYQEVSASLRILKPGGVILLHDFYPGSKPLYPDNNIISGPFQALERVKNENPKISVLPLGALPWSTKQGTNMTSLALVCKNA